MIQVPGGFDEADRYIAEHAGAGDLVITADIPLAAAVVEKDAHALSPRGELYGRENIRELLDLRNFMDTLRATGDRHGRAEPPFPRPMRVASRTGSTFCCDAT